jgi:hypothetical protein
MDKGCIETAREIVMRGVMEEDGLENGLRNIDMFTRARRIVITLLTISH